MARLSQPNNEFMRMGLYYNQLYYTMDNSNTKTNQQSLNNKNQLLRVYQEIMKKYGKETIQSKMTITHSNKNIFDDVLGVHAQRTLPKLEIDRQKPKHKPRNKYLSNKIIVNESVYINERETNKQEYLLPNGQSDQQGNINSHNTTIISDGSPQTGGVLSQRNKRIMSLYKKVQNNRNIQKSSFKVVHAVKKEETHKPEHQQPAEKQADMKKVDGDQTDKKLYRSIEQSKCELPKMKSYRSKSTISSKTLDYNLDSPTKILQCTKYEATRKSLNPKKERPLIELEDEKRIKNRSNLEKVYNVINNDSNKGNNANKNKTNDFSGVRYRKKTFNWKKQPLSLERITKQELFNLFRGYAGFSNIQQISIGFYKAYIGYGNNGNIIRQKLKERGFWMFVDSLDDDPHFVWTPLKYQQYSNELHYRKKLEPKNSISSHSSTLNELEQNREIKQFLRLKRNQFINGCQKVVNRQVFLKLINYLKERFKYNGNLQEFSRLKYQALDNFAAVKYKITQEAIRAYDIRLHNHIDCAGAIGNKKGLFHYLSKYAQIFGEKINEMIPETVHIDSAIFKQQHIFNKIPVGPWILKPGQQTNRGHGISIHIQRQSLISQLSKQKAHMKSHIKYTQIVQQYITPLLYNHRKFDIRIWILWNGSSRQAWWYQEGYIRTSSREFTLNNTNKFIHLTNDAIQCEAEDFGRYEPANKLSFNQFNKYLSSQLGYQRFYESMIPLMKELAVKVFRIGNILFDPLQKQHNFELFGFDYLIDTNFKPWLIECNTNPSLQISCSLLTRLVNNMIDNLLNITVDPLFPPSTKRKPKQPQPWNQQSFKFELIYDGSQDTELYQRVGKQTNIDFSYKGEYQQQFQCID